MLGIANVCVSVFKLFSVTELIQDLIVKKNILQNIIHIHLWHIPCQNSTLTPTAPPPPPTHTHTHTLTHTHIPVTGEMCTVHAVNDENSE